MRSQERGLGAQQVPPQSWRSRAASVVFPLRIGGRAHLGGSPVPWGGQAKDGVWVLFFSSGRLERIRNQWNRSGTSVPLCRLRRETLVLERFLLAITRQKSVDMQQPEQPEKGPAPPWQAQMPRKGATIQVEQALTSVTAGSPSPRATGTHQPWWTHALGHSCHNWGN